MATIPLLTTKIHLEAEAAGMPAQQIVQESASLRLAAMDVATHTAPHFDSYGGQLSPAENWRVCNNNQQERALKIARGAIATFLSAIDPDGSLVAGREDVKT